MITIAVYLNIRILLFNMLIKKDIYYCPVILKNHFDN